MDLTPEEVYLVSFDTSEQIIAKGIKVKHVTHCTPTKYLPIQPFKLDGLLLNSSTKEIIDPYGAMKDIEKKRITTVHEPEQELAEKPQLIIRAAALKAETGFSISERLLLSISKNVAKLAQTPGRFIWRELKRLIKSTKPSTGIEFLRLVGALDIILPELSNCFGITQNELYHKFTVYDHCLMACDLCPTNDYTIKFAALVHDVGKPGTKGKNEKGATFHKHEVLGSKLVANILNRLELHNSDEGKIIYHLVSNHMYQYDRKWKDSTVMRFVERVNLKLEDMNNLSLFPLFILRQADRLGREVAPITQKQRDFENRIQTVVASRSQKSQN